MKRIPKHKTLTYKSFPLFWIDCCNCDNQVKFERVWKFIIGTGRHGIPIKEGICTSCAQTQNEAELIAAEHEAYERAPNEDRRHHIAKLEREARRARYGLK